MNKTKLSWTIFQWFIILMIALILYNIIFLGKIPKRWRNNTASLENFQGCRSGFCA
jgi:hypothetical protein